MITIKVELTEEQAEALAQYTKRSGFKECSDNAVDDREAYLMRDGLSLVQDALAREGYNPR